MSNRTVCDNDLCTGCSACVNSCSHDAIHIVDSLKAYNAVVDSNKCINCGLCSKICPQNNSITKYSSISWQQGWICDEDARSKAASGGLAIAIEEAFVKNGGICYTCVFDNGRFIFHQFKDTESLKSAVGSKYVRSSAENVFKDIRAHLNNGEKVLFVGLPCQVAGLISFVGQKSKKLFTIDLICHGTPSPILLDKFLMQYGTSLENIKDISFREKNSFGSEQHRVRLVRAGLEDRYTYTFLKGINYTECCYKCYYAGSERISDITLGDSWGSELSINEKKLGISLILCQSEKGKKLLQMSNVQLFDVNIDIAKRNNKQLNKPMTRPETRDKFFEQLQKGKSYNQAVFSIAPKMVLKQDAKKVLLSLGFLKVNKNKVSYAIAIRK